MLGCGFYNKTKQKKKGKIVFVFPDNHSGVFILRDRWTGRHH